jgi:Amt family ammonium transporter
VCWYVSTAVKRRLGYDDSLDVFGVHGVGGFLGTVLAGVFAAGVFQGNQGDLAIGSQVATQLYAAAVTVAYTAVASFAILKGVDAVVGLRVAQEEETQGLDTSLHAEVGYDL